MYCPTGNAEAPTTTEKFGGDMVPVTNCVPLTATPPAQVEGVTTQFPTTVPGWSGPAGKFATGVQATDVDVGEVTVKLNVYVAAFAAEAVISASKISANFIYVPPLAAATDSH